MNTAQVYGAVGAPLTGADVGPVSATPAVKFVELLETQLKPPKETPSREARREVMAVVYTMLRSRFDRSISMASVDNENCSPGPKTIPSTRSVKFRTSFGEGKVVILDKASMEVL